MEMYCYCACKHVKVTCVKSSLRYQGLFGEHAATMLQFMWQDDIRGVAMLIKECLGVYHGTDPDGGQASNDQILISPRWLEKM